MVSTRFARPRRLGPALVPFAVGVLISSAAAAESEPPTASLGDGKKPNTCVLTWEGFTSLVKVESIELEQTVGGKAVVRARVRRARFTKGMQKLKASQCKKIRPGAEQAMTVKACDAAGGCTHAFVEDRRAGSRRAAIKEKIAGAGLLARIGARGDAERAKIEDFFGSGSALTGSLSSFDSNLVESTSGLKVSSTKEEEHEPEPIVPAKRGRVSFSGQPAELRRRVRERLVELRACTSTVPSAQEVELRYRVDGKGRLKPVEVSDAERPTHACTRRALEPKKGRELPTGELVLRFSSGS